jgi:iron complex transport system substrate-binding protein
MLDRRAFIKRVAGGVILTFVGAGAAGALSGCQAVSDVLTGEREFTDDYGRTHLLPAPGKIEKVYFTSGLAEIFCFTLNSDIIAGNAIQVTEEKAPYLPENIRNLTYMGSLSEDGEINRELLIAEGVQVVFSISAVGLTEANKADAVELQSATNIPVVLLDGSMNIITDCYTKLGSILGRESRAAELAAYCSRVYDDVIGAVADLTEDEKVNFYYAEGPQGLQTEPSTSQHALVFDLAGAKNVAQVPEGTAYGMSDVSLEQVIAWDPEVIIAWSWEVMGGADERIKASSNWANIKAVRDGRVYTMPDIPFAWLDRPPGVNRFLGLQWIANLFYPERYDIDMVEEGKAFYELFYQIEVSDDEMKGFLGNSYPVGGTA